MTRGRSGWVRISAPVADRLYADARALGVPVADVVAHRMFGDPIRPHPHPLAARQHHVYRLIDDTGQVLYVGMTFCLSTRLSQHARGGRTWASHTATEYPDRASARAAEREAIATLRPPWNRYA